MKMSSILFCLAIPTLSADQKNQLNKVPNDNGCKKELFELNKKGSYDSDLCEQVLKGENPDFPGICNDFRQKDGLNFDATSFCVQSSETRGAEIESACKELGTSEIPVELVTISQISPIFSMEGNMTQSIQYCENFKQVYKNIECRNNLKNSVPWIDEDKDMCDKLVCKNPICAIKILLNKFNQIFTVNDEL